MSTARKQWNPQPVLAVRGRKKPSAYDFERAMGALREIHELRKKAEQTAPRRKA